MTTFLAVWDPFQGPVTGVGYAVRSWRLSPIHTADADATQLSSWVASAVCRLHNSQQVGDSLDESEQICQQRRRVASCRLCERTRRQSWPSLFHVLLVTSNDIMTSMLKKVINIDQSSRSQTAMLSFQILSTESVGSRRKLIANCVHTADAESPTRHNSTVASRPEPALCSKCSAKQGRKL